MIRCFRRPFAGIFYALTFIAITGAANGYAAERLLPSSSEDVAIAFYRKIETIPDFSRWIEESDKFKEAKPVNQLAITSRETNRLKQKYWGFNPAKDLVTIEFPVTASITNVLDAPERPYLLEFTTGKEKIDYFPYSIAGLWIAVIVDDFQKHMTYRLTESEYRMILKGWPELEKRRTNLPIRLHTKIRAADAKAPVLLDDQYQWLMLTEVASLSIWKDNIFIWEYQAPWYETAAEAELKKLFRE